MCSGPPTSAAPKPNMPRTPSSQRQCQSPQAESPPSAEDEPHPEEALAHATGIHFAALRQFATLRYDPTQIPMREAVMECLGLASEGDDELTLASLQGDPTADQRGRGGGRGPSTYWIRRWKMRSEASKRGFERAYLQLLQGTPRLPTSRGACCLPSPHSRRAPPRKQRARDDCGPPPAESLSQMSCCHTSETRAAFAISATRLSAAMFLAVGLPTGGHTATPPTATPALSSTFGFR